MRISEREMILGTATLAVLLIAVTFILGKPVIDKYKELGANIEQQKRLLEKQQSMIAARADWDARFTKISKLMPEFAAERKMDIHWLTVMDQIAAKNGLTITKRQVGEEKQIGDVYELTIDVREWQGSLDALTHFLFDLQDLGVMLDIKQLYVKPLDASNLRGRFTLNCAFSRQGAAE